VFPDAVEVQARLLGQPDLLSRLRTAWAVVTVSPSGFFPAAPKL
jgi:hypothetical protein